MFVRIASTVILIASISVSARAQVAKKSMFPAGDTIEHRSFFSAALQRDLPYEVVLPAAYAESQQRYPVLYLLHGWQGDETNWVKLTHLVELASQYRLLIVMPRAENSWYVNSATRSPDRYEDAMTHDLIEEIDASYRTIATRHERAIAGLSMGGYGAMLYTLKHPDLFGATASISGAFAGPAGIEKVMPQLKPSTDAAFGLPNSAERHDGDLDTWIAQNDPSRLPYLFLECGTTDPLLESNRHVVAELSARRFAYEYHELPGSHTWSFWDHALPMMLAVVAQQLHVEPAGPVMPGTAVQRSSLHRKESHVTSLP